MFSNFAFKKFDEYQAVLTVDVKKTKEYTKKKVMQFSNVVEKVFIGLVISTTINSFMYSYYVYTNRNAQYYIFPDNSIILIIGRYLLSLNVFTIIIPGILGPIYFIYGLFHIGVQNLLLADFADSFDENFEAIKATGPQNYRLEKAVTKFLNTIIQKHLNIKGYHNDIYKSKELVYLFYVLNGFLLSITALLVVINDTFNLFMGMGLLMLFLTYVYGCCEVAHYFQNSYADLAMSIYNLKWYNWDLKSQKTYLTLYGHFSEGLTLSAYGFFCIDRELMKRMCRGTYTFASCLYTLRNN